MSIGKRVTESFEKMLKNDTEGAFFAICAAIEPTARREGRSRGRTGYKDFIVDNFNIISAIGLGFPVKSLSIPYSHPELPGSNGAPVPLQDIIYHVIRCGLYHEASLPDNVFLTERTIGHDNNTALRLPKNLAAGLIVAVVASPANAEEVTESSFYVATIAGDFVLNDIWGKRDEVRQLLVKAAENSALKN